jgi:hypothetical protein
MDIERTHINQKIEIFENPTSPCQTTVDLLDLEKQNWLAAKLLKDFSVLFNSQLPIEEIVYKVIELGLVNNSGKVAFPA